MEYEGWGWGYKYPYAPFIEDLGWYMENVLQSKKHKMSFDNLAEFETFPVSTPFEQLLSVIPPQSQTLLPLAEENFFPSLVHVDYEGVTREHMGVVLLPYISLKRIAEEVSEKVSPLKEYKRNTFSKNQIFRYLDSRDVRPQNFENRYGVLSKVKVSVIWF